MKSKTKRWKWLLYLFMMLVITFAGNILQVQASEIINSSEEVGKIQGIDVDGKKVHITFWTNVDAILGFMTINRISENINEAKEVNVIAGQTEVEITLKSEFSSESEVLEAFLISKESSTPLSIVQKDWYSETPYAYYEKEIGERIVEAIDEGGRKFLTESRTLYSVHQYKIEKLLDNVKDFYYHNGTSGAITKNGDLYLWGSNESGQVGNGSTDEQLHPLKILEKVRSFDTCCKMSGALSESGDLFLWGDNKEGRVGNGVCTNQYIPTKVLQGVKSFKLGEYVSSAILENGDLYLWGNNFFGTVGNGSGGWEEQIVCSPTKVLENVVEYQSSYGTSGALTESGDLFMWGDNSDGKVGNGGDTGEPQYKPIKVLESVQSFQIGSWMSCAIINDGGLYTWGYSNSGALGNGKIEWQSVPVKILDDVDFFYNYNSVSGALTKTGDLYMWGSNEGGQVGNGNAVDQYSPIKILENIKKFKISESSCAALDKEGNLYMWGSYHCYEDLKEFIDNNIEITYHIVKIQEQIMDFDISWGNCNVVTNSGDYYSWYFDELGKVKMRPRYIVRGHKMPSDATEIYTMNGVIVKAELPLSIGDATLQVVCVSDNAIAEDFFGHVTSIEKDQYKIYNICFMKDNVEQEINTNVTVRIPIPTSFDANKSAIYRQDKDGSWTKLDSKIEGNYLEFVTNHFSLYAIAEEKSLNNNATTLISSITLNMNNGTVTQSGYLKLDATIAPSNATNKTLLWSSDNPSVAMVDQNGLVTAVSAGKATITAKAQDGSGISAACIVEVTGSSNNGGSNTGGGSSSGGGNSSGGGSSSGGSTSGGGSTGSGNNTSSGGTTTPGNGNASTPTEPSIKVLYYIVNFDKNGGKNLSRQKMTLLQDDSLGILPKVERKNYKFLGWFTQPTGGEKVDQKKVLNVSTSLFAHWEKISKPSKGQISSLRSKKAGTMTIKCKKQSEAKGHEIAYSRDKKFKASATKKKVSTSTSATIKGLKKGQTYYVKIRAYKVDSTGVKVYGGYSSIKKVKIKK